MPKKNQRTCGRMFPDAFIDQACHAEFVEVSASCQKLRSGSEIMDAFAQFRGAREQDTALGWIPNLSSIRLQTIRDYNHGRHCDSTVFSREGAHTVAHSLGWADEQICGLDRLAGHSTNQLVLVIRPWPWLLPIRECLSLPADYLVGNRRNEHIHSDRKTVRFSISPE